MAATTIWPRAPADTFPLLQKERRFLVERGPQGRFGSGSRRTRYRNVAGDAEPGRRRDWPP